MKTALRLLLAAGTLMLAACSNHDTAEVPQQGNSVNIGQHVVNLEGPVAANCSLIGGQLRLARQLDGSSVGMCQMANGRRCSESALMSGACTAS